MGEFALYLWRLSRPEVWYFAVVPLYVGYLLASRELFPGLDVWIRFLARAHDEGVTGAEALRMAASWAGATWRFWLAAFVMGPLLWTATLLINDVHDLPGDRLNPRKARSPLVEGLVSARSAHRAAYGFALLAFLAAWGVGATFALLALGCLVLAWLYSAPPVRLKTVPGADVAVNILGAAILCGLAGWSLAAPLSAAPFQFLPQAVLVGAAIYIPTTLVDYDADQAVGYATIATKLGRRRAFNVGWACWVAANLGALGLAWMGWFLPRAMFSFLLVFVPVLLVEYWVLIGKAQSPAEMLRGITVCSLTFLACNAVFAFMYTGWWR